MTLLSDALRRAQTDGGTPPESELTAPAPAWQFSPVETMHVPEEPPPVRRLPLHLGDAERHKLVGGGLVAHSLVEQYRHLAALLHHAQKSRGLKSVMVTSALPAEGKTLTATNLALTLSESYQRRVLLVDGDLRRPRMRDMFGLPPSEGLTDSLAAPMEGKLPVHQVSSTLWVLTSGRVLPDPMSLLVSPIMKDLLDDAKASFDWVIVDTPPIAILSDANLLASMIDTTLIVVSARSTPYPLVQRAVDAVGHTRILGVVLNRAELIGLPETYGYYGANAYKPRPAMERRGWFRWLKRGGKEHAASA